MSKTKEKTRAPATAKKELLVETATPESIVDEVFDTMTAWAAQGLSAAKRGLEASARWLDARAKLVGELAAKLSSTAHSGDGRAQKA